MTEVQRAGGNLFLARGQPTVGGEIPGGDLELRKKWRPYEVVCLTSPMEACGGSMEGNGGDRGRRLAPKDGPGHNVLIAVPQPRPARRQQQRQRGGTRADEPHIPFKTNMSQQDYK